MPLRNASRMSFLALALVSALLGVACETPREEARRPTPSSMPSSSTAPSLHPSQSPTAAPPDPDRPLPSQPALLAKDLADTTQRLLDEIDAWTAAGRPPGSGRATVELLALRHQRLHRKLVASPQLSRAVLRNLPARASRSAHRNIVAGRRLRSLVTPVKGPVKLPTRPPEPPGDLLRYYRSAERRYNIPWQVLASLNFVESRFGRLTGPSAAGALGPMQFLPSTWDAYGRGGDVMDPHDAILGAANYLAASGAPQRLNGALFAYNRSDAYVDAIRLYAREIARDRRNFYVFYFWQVFVATTRGDVQLTGPGAKAP